MTFLLISVFVSLGMAQNNTSDFCARHANLWDSEGRITLEGHKMLYLQHPDWWFDAENKQWREWPSRSENQWSKEEHKELYVDGPEWWFDSQTKEWKDWPQEQRETLECHKKLYLSSPQWWFDSKEEEWKRWPK